MREIKFRAWDEETREMSYDYLNKNWLLVCIKSPYVKIMQYTGLKDKNGIEIFEGDVVLLTNANGFTTLAIVQFLDGCFEVKFDQPLLVRKSMTEYYHKERDYLKCFVANHAVEVIGNIYENPELVGEQDE